MGKVKANKGGAFFIDDPGKTFLYRALLAKIRSEGYIALATATSGIAASLLPGAPMAKRSALEALDDLLQDLMDSTEIFGGKVVVLSGDFRQTLPVVRNGDGKEISDDNDFVTLPTQIIVENNAEANQLNVLIDYVYPNIFSSSTNIHSTLNRAILTTKNNFVHEINDILIHKFPGEKIKYISFDETLDPNDQAHYKDLLHSLTPNGMPPH
ncbi:unnamed protein product [Lactuca saligna]|uniref:ATP-dependent DNA helicase n=1 Tax=Lactuca saligna TaxID=75948 RepID=A0AA36EHE3_LACSI|nr:unnamed protein product [Lactuca saligna]